MEIEIVQKSLVKLKEELDGLQKAIDNLSPAFVPRIKTFYEVTGFPKREIYASNVLAFLFTSDEDHGLGDLWIRALYKAIGENVSDEFLEASANREVKTLENGSIDLMIDTSIGTIGIENKLFAGLQNKLTDYRKTVEEHYRRTVKEQNEYEKVQSESDKVQNESDNVKCVLLHLSSQQTNEEGWINLSYESLFESVKQLSGNYYSRETARWFIFMEDFMTTMTRLVEPMDENDERIEFLGKNLNVISQASLLLDEGFNWAKKHRNGVKDALNGMLGDVDAIISDQSITAVPYNEIRNYYASVYVNLPVAKNSKLSKILARRKTDCNSDETLAIEMFCDYSSWRMGVFLRKGSDKGIKSGFSLGELLDNEEFKQYIRDSYYWKINNRDMQRWYVSSRKMELSSSNEELAKAMLTVIEKLTPLAVSSDS